MATIFCRFKPHLEPLRCCWRPLLEHNALLPIKRFTRSDYKFILLRSDHSGGVESSVVQEATTWREARVGEERQRLSHPAHSRCEITPGLSSYLWTRSNAFLCSMTSADAVTPQPAHVYELLDRSWYGRKHGAADTSLDQLLVAIIAASHRYEPVMQTGLCA
jgi:hypothetical protein